MNVQRVWMIQSKVERFEMISKLKTRCLSARGDATMVDSDNGQ